MLSVGVLQFIPVIAGLAANRVNFCGIQNRSERWSHDFASVLLPQRSCERLTLSIYNSTHRRNWSEGRRVGLLLG